MTEWLHFILIVFLLGALGFLLIVMPLWIYADSKADKRAAAWIEAQGYDVNEVARFISCNDNWDLTDFVQSEALKKAYARFLEGDLPPVKTRTH